MIYLDVWRKKLEAKALWRLSPPQPELGKHNPWWAGCRSLCSWDEADETPGGATSRSRALVFPQSMWLVLTKPAASRRGGMRWNLHPQFQESRSDLCHRTTENHDCVHRYVSNMTSSTAAKHYVFFFFLYTQINNQLHVKFAVTLLVIY